ncbi:MAG: 30S ribosomal protein S5 [Candidatus Andersenbacteria bacterium]
MNQAATETSKDRQGGRGRRHTFARGGGQRQYDHEVLDVARVVRVVKGGRRFRFRASVIVGDRSGSVGFGIGKSRDVQQAIQKAQDQATKNLVKINLKDDTIPHTVQAKYNGAVVFLKPAKPGTGVIAGGTIRIVADLCGIKNLVSKALGSSNRASNARATIKALQSIIKK